MLPATADALEEAESVGVLPQSKRGLETHFEVGEKIPWKGIWFRIEMLTSEAILLKPEGETWKHHKKRTGRA